MHRRRLGQPPEMKDDKEVLPLQAADLLAWFLRRVNDQAYRGITEDRMPLPSLVRYYSNIPLATTTFDEELLLQHKGNIDNYLQQLE